MFDSTTIHAAGGTANAKSAASASINTPAVVTSTSDSSKFIKFKLDSETAVTMFNGSDSYFMTGHHTSTSSPSDGYKRTCELADKVTVKIKQIVCYGDSMLVEFEELSRTKLERVVYSNCSFGEWNKCS